MTEKAIQKQIEDIKNKTAEILKSKEATRKFLLDHGIIKENGKEKNHSKEKK